MHYFVVDRTSVYVGLTQTPDQPTTDCTHKKIGLKRPPKKDAGGDGCTRMRTSCFYCLFFLRNYSQDWLSEVKQKNVDWF